MDSETPTPKRRFGGLSGKAATAALAVGLMAGGGIGGFLISHAATPTPSPSGTSAPSGSGSSTTTPDPADPHGGGAFHPNENASHESGESAAREAQENAGQHPTVP